MTALVQGEIANIDLHVLPSDLIFSRLEAYIVTSILQISCQ